jgi:hypothetical protein
MAAGVIPMAMAMATTIRTATRRIMATVAATWYGAAYGHIMAGACSRFRSATTDRSIADGKGTVEAADPHIPDSLAGFPESCRAV